MGQLRSTIIRRRSRFSRSIETIFSPAVGLDRHHSSAISGRGISRGEPMIYKPKWDLSLDDVRPAESLSPMRLPSVLPPSSQSLVHGDEGDSCTRFALRQEILANQERTLGIE